MGKKIKPKKDCSDHITDPILCIGTKDHEKYCHVWGNNLDAWKLGEIVVEVNKCKNVGDYIDRGLILIRMLKQKGFKIYREDV